MKLYGLIGYPVKHSLSAVMHNAAFKAFSIDAEYRLFEVPPGDLGIFFKTIIEKNIFGLNVTIPHKQEVLKYLYNLDKEAERLLKFFNLWIIDSSRKGATLAGFCLFLKVLLCLISLTVLSISFNAINNPSRI